MTANSCPSIATPAGSTSGNSGNIALEDVDTPEPTIALTVSGEHGDP